MLRYLLTILMMQVLVLAACSGKSDQVRPDIEVTPVPDALQSLPDLATLDKINSPSIVGKLRIGSDYLEASAGAFIEDASLRFEVVEDELQFAVYRFDSQPQDILSSVGYSAADKATFLSKIYVFVADYSLGRWRMITSTDANAIFSLAASAGQYTSPAGHTYVAMLAWSGDSYLLHSVELAFGNINPAPGPWPTAGGSNLRRGYSPDLAVETANIHWKAQLQNGLAHSAPVQATDGTIYMGSYDPQDSRGSIFAVDGNGQLKWEYEALDDISATVAISPLGHVLFGDLTKHFYAVNSAGVLAWTHQPPREVYSSAAVLDDGSFYFGSPGLQLLKWDYLGNEQWILDVSSGIYSPPSVAVDGTIYVPTSGGHLLCVDPAGTLNWEYVGAGESHASACITSDDTVVYATQDGNIYAVNTVGGEAGLYAAGGSFEGAPALGPDGNIYIGNMDGYLYKLDSSAGLIDSFDAGSPIEGSVVIDADGTVFLGTTGGTLYALKPDLSIQWQYESGESFRAGLAIGENGILLAATVSGTLTAFAPNDPVIPAVPMGLAASQGLYSDFVRLTWDEQFDATGFEIYRDGGLVPIASVDYVTEWSDTGLLDDTVHTYTLVAVNETGSSEPSADVSGYANAVLPGAGEWNMFAGDAANSGHCVLSGPHTKQLAWEYPTGSPGFGSPVIGASGEIYFPTSGDNPKIISVSSAGAFRWEYAAAGELGMASAIDDNGYVYGGSYETVFRLKPDGSEDWSVSYSNYSFGAPTLLADAVLICGAISGGAEQTLSLSLTDGSENWTYPEGARFCAPAVGTGGLVYVGSDSNRIYVINPDGNPNSERGGNSSVDGSAVIALNPVDGDLLLFISSQKIYAYLGATFQYTYPTDNKTMTGMAFHPDELSYCTIGDEASRLDLAGNELWTAVSSKKTQYQMPAVDADGYMYYGGIGTVLRCVDPAGVEAWSYDTGTDLRYSTPAIGPDNRVYILGENGTLYAFEPAP